jgi:YidC/Oxa1 family membrane protein insertase
MDKNNLIGFVLIALVLIGFSWYTRPSEEEQRAAFVQDSIAQVARMNAEKQRQVEAAAKEKEAKEKVLNDTAALFHSAMNGT